MRGMTVELLLVADVIGLLWFYYGPGPMILHWLGVN